MTRGLCKWNSVRRMDGLQSLVLQGEALCARSLLEKVFEKVLDRMQIMWQQEVH